MKVKLIKRSSDERVIVELEDHVGHHEEADGALARLERSANYFLKDRESRLKESKRKPISERDTQAMIDRLGASINPVTKEQV